MTIAIDAEPIDQWTVKITNFYYSDVCKKSNNCGDFNENDLYSDAEFFKNNLCVYVLSRKYNGRSRLLLNKKPVKTCELGTITCYYLDENVIIPCDLIEDATTIL